MGFDAVFYARIDHQEKLKRVSQKTLEYVHIPSKSADEESIFEHILFNHYESPKNF